MPFYGGVIGINKVSGPIYYDKANNPIKGINIDNGSL
jgi:hypothetical protein